MISRKNDKKKLIRLLCFSLTSLLVMTVGAAVYNYMYMQAMPVTVQAAKVIFQYGTDATEVGTSVGTNGTYVKFTNMSGWPNATRIYENATIILNQDPAKDFSVQLTCDPLSGSTSFIDALYVQIYDASNALQGAVDVKAGNSTSFTILAGQALRVQWSIKWNANTPAGSTVTATLMMVITGEGTDE